jgi:molybdenum cofactor cytidylyltransferase
LQESKNGALVAGAVILAAGMSRRMGRPKALLDLGGQPLIRRLAQTVRQAPVGPVIVVTGHEPAPIQDALDGLKFRFVHNPQYEAGGMLSSIQTGVGAISDFCDAFFLLLLDQPLVQASTLKSMWEAWQLSGQAIVVPRYRNRRGHPILISIRYAGLIQSLPPTASLRDFVVRQRSQTGEVRVDDRGVASDVDTPADYLAIQRLLGK